MVKLISIFVALLGLAAGCADAPDRGEASDGARAPEAAGVEAQAGDVEAGAVCTNSQCFDGDSGPPKADGWDWDKCSYDCFTCGYYCRPKCTGVGWCPP